MTFGRPDHGWGNRLRMDLRHERIRLLSLPTFGHASMKDQGTIFGELARAWRLKPSEAELASKGKPEPDCPCAQCRPFWTSPSGQS